MVNESVTTYIRMQYKTSHAEH